MTNQIEQMDIFRSCTQDNRIINLMPVMLSGLYSERANQVKIQNLEEREVNYVLILRNNE